MKKKLIIWGALLLLTFANLRLFLSRWSELPVTKVTNLLSERELSSAILGITLGAALALLISKTTRFKVLPLLLLPASIAAFLWRLWPIQSFGAMFPSTIIFVAVAAALGLLAFSIKETEIEPKQSSPFSSFFLYTLASLNFFFLISPFTSYPPSYVQDSTNPAPSMAFFYYGSVHSDMSMVMVLLRSFINSFFDYPSLNATGLISMLLVSFGLAFAALAAQWTLGAVWGWALLLACWSDRWLLSGAIASSVVGMPILSTGSIFFLCIWALTRRSAPLSGKEAVFLGIFNAISVFYNLYSYSAARIPWVIGSCIAGVILLSRGAFPIRASSLARIATSIVPSVLVLASLLYFVFAGDTTRFKAQILISPRPEQIIKNVNDYPTKVNSIHDVDMPIWWGTGRPEGVNASVYWRRTPGEILEKVDWFFGQLGILSPIAPYLVVCACLAIIIGICSSNALKRNFTIVSALMLFGAFSPFLLAQDVSAFRRAVSTDLLLMILVLSIFAFQQRRGALSIISPLLFLGFCIAKAPIEFRYLIDNSLHTQLCVACHDFFNARKLVNDPVFEQVRTRNLHFVINSQDFPPHLRTCSSVALNSAEMRKMLPSLEVIDSPQTKTSEVYAKIPEGDVLVATCPTSLSEGNELKEICEGQPTYGKLLGSILDPNAPWSTKPKWLFIERLAQNSSEPLNQVVNPEPSNT
jgi:hypothetical protein